MDRKRICGFNHYILIIFFYIFYFAFIQVNLSYSKNYKILIKQKNKEIGNLEKRLKELKKKKLSLDADEKTGIENIKDLESEIDITEKLSLKLDEKRLTIKRELDSVETSYKNEINDVNELSTRLEKFLKNMYLISKQKRSQMLMNFKDIRKMKRYMLYYELYYNYGISLRDSLNREKEFLSFKKNELDLKVNDFNKTKLKLKEKGNDLKTLKKSKKKYLETIRDSKKKLSFEFENIKKSKKEVERLIENLVKKSMKKKSRKKHRKVVIKKGIFSMPVNGKIVRAFGKYRDKKYKTTLINKGVDIKSSGNLRVIAAIDGVVVKVGYFRNLKNYVIVENKSGFYTFYSKLENINVMEHDKIKKNEIIGALSKKDNILHFEIRNGKKAVDPIKYLR